MGFGLGRLGLSSRDFWALTPRELAAAFEGVFGPAETPLARTALDRLMQRYPDERKG